MLFLDFEQKEFNRELVRNLPINLLYIEEEICCKFLKTEQCECPHDFNLQENFLVLATDLVKKVLHTMVSDDVELTTNLSCDSRYNEDARSKFYKLLQQEVDLEPLIYKENFGLYVNIEGTIEANSEKVAEYNYKTGVTVVDGKQIKPITAFYRIGITHVWYPQYELSTQIRFNFRLYLGHTKKPTPLENRTGRGTASTLPTS